MDLWRRWGGMLLAVVSMTNCISQNDNKLPSAGSLATSSTGDASASGGKAARVKRVYGPELTTFAGAETKGAADAVVWLHPSYLSSSLVVTADAVSGNLFSYDLSGNLVDTFAAPGVRQLDIRYNFPWGEESVALIAASGSGQQKLLLMTIDLETLKFMPLAKEDLLLGENVASALCKDRKGRFYAMAASLQGGIRQFEIIAAAGGVKLAARREIKLHGALSSLVCDDQLGRAFAAEEGKGVWSFGVNPEEPAAERLVLPTGQSLPADSYGLGLCPVTADSGYLVVSVPSQSQFLLYRREPPHTLLDAFAIDEVKRAQRVSCTQIKINQRFTEGLFLTEDGKENSRRTIGLDWSQIRRTLGLEPVPATVDPRTL
jgi:myo-inositol-hexaphosphate 3-phosphohydrolase